MDIETILTDYRRLMWKIINDFVKTNNIPFDHGDDIFQEACIRLHEKLPTYDKEKSSIRTFVCTATEIACMRYRREHFKAAALSLEEVDVAWIEPGYDKMLQVIEAYKSSDFNKKVITQKFDGYTQQEIAEQLNISQSTVSRILSEFKDYLLDELKNN